MTDTIKIQLEETGSLMRLPCTVCGFMNDRAYIMAMGDSEHGKIRICMSCHKDDDIDTKLEEHASRLESAVSNIRALKGAHEEDLQRRARAGLAIIESMAP